MKEIKIACVGDIMCGDSFYSLGVGVASSLDKYGKDFLPSEIVDFLSKHDIVLCNNECVLSDLGREEYSVRSLHMRGRASAAQHLSSWGIKIANLANNHILEHGYDTAIDTVRNLEGAGIKTIGAGGNKLFQRGLQIEEIVCGENTLVFLGMCLQPEKYAFNGGVELHEVVNAIKNMTMHNKIVCVSIHWGDEFIDRPSISQKKAAQLMIKAGATMIIGHHPHVVQGIQDLGGHLIAYSLGNFIFGGFWEDAKWSIVLSVTISGNKIIEWQYIPIEMDSECRPRFAISDRKIRLECEIGRRCDLLTQEISDKCYQKQYEVDLISLGINAKRKLYLKLLKNTLCINPIYWPQILWRPIQRRIGLW